MLTSTGNAYFLAAGTAEWEDSDDTHYARTYARGAHNCETTIMGGDPIFNKIRQPAELVAAVTPRRGRERIRLGNADS